MRHLFTTSRAANLCRDHSEQADRAVDAESPSMFARESGFDVIYLLEALKPHAEKEMLYYCDDHHWNVRGNALVAAVIRKALGR